MKRFTRASPLLFVAILAACSAVKDSPARANSHPLPFALVTVAANASPTATAFQPPAGGLATPTSLYYAVVPTRELILPTATATATEPPPPEPSPTIDLGALFPTAAAPPAPEPSSAAPAPLPSLGDTDTVNFLLIGSDKRPGTSFRTDTMVLVILWPKENQVSMISIPRDLWIYIPSVGMQRINTAYQSGELIGYDGGGPGLLRDTIAYNLGIRVDHMAMVEFDGFRRIVNTLGGLDVPVACPYTDWHLIDPSYDPEVEGNWALYTVNSGVVHMDGDLALWYARSREKSNDFDRARRQQEVLRSIFARAMSTDALSRIPQLYADFASSIKTDLGLADLLKLALYAPHLSNAMIRSYYIRPPYVSDWTTPGGAEVLLPDQPALQQLMTQATTLSTTAVQRETLTVQVENGTPTDGWDALAASRLNYAGYSTRIAPADRRNYDTSVLVDITAGQDTAARAAILNGLGLYSASVISSPDPGSPVQYRLILGSDYQPCFQPQELAH